MPLTGHFNTLLRQHLLNGTAYDMTSGSHQHGPIPHFLCYKMGLLVEYEIIWDPVPVDVTLCKHSDGG